MLRHSNIIFIGICDLGFYLPRRITTYKKKCRREGTAFSFHLDCTAFMGRVWLIAGLIYLSICRPVYTRIDRSIKENL